MDSWEAFYGPNVGYALELYERYLTDPGSVDPETRGFFDRLQRNGGGAEGIAATLERPATPVPGTNGRAAPPRAEPTEAAPQQGTGELAEDTIAKVVLAARLARGIREYGHLDAAIDPLGAPRPGDPMLDPATHHLTDDDLRRLPASIVWPSAGPDYGTCLDAIHALRRIYCGPIGYDFDHIQDFTERAWLHASVESGTYRTPFSRDQQQALLRRLTEVEGFEQFIHTVYQNQKRFSIEGNDALIPMLDAFVAHAAETGTREVLIGMAHRGRLNVLTHVLGKPPGLIFSAFHTAAKQEMEPPLGEGDTDITGDVKYHLGWRRVVATPDGGEMEITLADNPSHLEVIDPVVEGFARAAQDDRTQPGPPRQDVTRALPITIHGDAAFPGEGVVAETLNLTNLEGYETGGSVRIIVNNQVGFTTTAAEGRSTLYASDLAKGFEIPIVHVNADDPEACLHAVRLAFAYRDRFHKDFLIDLIGYRRWGHNEGDEPGFTQPRMYALIRQHPTVRAQYADRLVREGVVSAEEVEVMQREVRDLFRRARDESEEGGNGHAANGSGVSTPHVETRVGEDQLRALNDALLARPDGFAVNSRLDRILSRRREAIDRPGGIDWAFAETLAFASILADGTPIRMSGQDAERGTFSQRHLVLHDTETGDTFVPLQRISQARASFAVYNSPLTETAVIGFEYGYSVHAQDALVLWEAQFGDFANVGQVVIDQFISAARAKWQQTPTLALLLPHGYEGQGPEHSSARLERFLQLAAEDNVRIVNCTTAAQYFHVLRLQAATLGNGRRPLVIMTPKSLLRHPRAGSSLGDLAGGTFQPVLDTSSAGGPDEVTRLILCTGKIAIDLETSLEEQPHPSLAVARVEQLYPFPHDALRRVLDRHPHLREVVWAQEEPANMGAWAYAAARLPELLPDGVPLQYVGRQARASTAEGAADAHEREQARILAAALAVDAEPHTVKIETRGVQNVG